MVKQERARRTLQRIVAAAANRFEENGYSGTTLDDISREAGVSKGALYFHFASKQEVADAVTAHSYGLLEDLLDAVRGSDGSAVQQLIDLTHGLSRLLYREPTLRAALRFHRDRTHLGTEIDHYALWQGGVEECLARAAERRELRVGLPAAAGRVLAMITLFSVESLAVRRVPDREATQQITDLWNVLLGAYAAPADGAHRTGAPRPCPVG
ncbi:MULTISPECIES: ScbR family autoregulator-binding transcription factor [Streptomyces]|uniref:ScbR family autoregulator-binding transcription factor n=1 Tax=Streptomyces TaxID=1883 RepID=UPI0002E27ACF|nr:MULTISPECIES: ScbR family autoregulator-binding transcription factor [Streptomyces]MYX41049.1 TetR family transcriptional regulator [Streptomyces sp. SID89]NED77508.1 TetR/AcrR family transcriptional regulator [Streptomyces sp. SID9944]MBY8864125.1 TetR/AcrR family transcriptional regulator [Streptomyces sennicomposti]NED34547.1 TetR/AcrR family transcriptional regulator [Streptomyces sp. SID8499]NMO33823.1 TetR/AcrR family transcriptional regulator [Streptomyces sp. GMY02]